MPWDPERGNGGSIPDLSSGQTFYPLLARLRAAEARNRWHNALSLGVMASPPTITTGTTELGGLTKTYYVASGGSPLATAANFKYKGGVPTITSSIYYRFPSVTVGSGGNVSATQQANGWAVEFYADAVKVELFVLCSTSAKGLQIEVNDQPVSSAITALPATSGGGYILLDFTSVGGRAVRKIRVEGDQATGWRGVLVGATESVWSFDPDHDIIACSVGDSIEAQQGGTSPNTGWQIVAGKCLGWSDVREVALGGTGWVNQGAWSSTFGDANRVADVVAARPSVVILAASPNDTSGATLQAAMLAGFQAYRAALPYALIVCTGLFPGASGPGTSDLNIEANMLAAFNSWADPFSFYIPIANDAEGSWIFGTGHVGAINGSGNSDIYVNSADTVHPSEAGHIYVGERFANAFRQKVLQAVA